MSPEPRYYREGPCEHGQVHPHWAPHSWCEEPAICESIPAYHACPGGTRVEVTIDYEAAAEMVKRYTRAWDYGEMAHAIVDAALGEDTNQ